MEREKAKAVVVLHQGAAKRLIAKGVVALPQVKRALEEGMVVVTLGTTNAYVAEELTGRPVDKVSHCAGYIGRELAVVPAERRGKELVLVRGTPVELPPEEVLERLSAGDVVIKGGNVLDSAGNVGVFVASRNGGTVGRYVVPALARGAEIVIPISRAKSIHGSVLTLSRDLGIERLQAAMGYPIGLYPLQGTVVTETEAVELLYGVRARHLASCGVGPGEGAVTLLISGEEDAVSCAFAELKRLSEEEPPLVFDVDTG